MKTLIFIFFVVNTIFMELEPLYFIKMISLGQRSVCVLYHFYYIMYTLVCKISQILCQRNFCKISQIPCPIILWKHTCIIHIIVSSLVTHLLAYRYTIRSVCKELWEERNIFLFTSCIWRSMIRSGLLWWGAKWSLARSLLC